MKRLSTLASATMSLLMLGSGLPAGSAPRTEGVIEEGLDCCGV
jgi:hypothetical protein